MKKILHLFALFIPQCIFAQKASLWEVPTSTARQGSLAEWHGMQTSVRQLNVAGLETLLRQIKTEGSASIAIPHPSGQEVFFTIQPSHLLPQKLQDKYPSIQTYKGTNGRGETVRLDVNPDGIHATIYFSGDMVCLEQLAGKVINM